MIIVCSLCACDKPAEFLNNFWNGSNASNNSNSNTNLQGDGKEKAEPVLSPQSAVRIYLNNFNTWKVDKDTFYMNGTYYLFLDINFDGILELICSTCDGSGRYSQNRYYKINTNDYSVVQLDYHKSVSIDKDESFCDYYNKDKFMLLEDKNKGEKSYLVYDYLRVSSDDYGMRYDILKSFEESIYFESKFSTHVISAVGSSSGTNEDKYFIYENDQSTEVSEAEYNELFNSFLGNHKDLSLEFNYIFDAQSFEALSAEEQYQKLLDIYMSFSYDGFSWDDIETYDIEFETTAEETSPVFEPSTEQLTCLVDYKGLTINDISDMWGADFALTEGLFQGGWKCFGYTDRRIPVAFYYAVKSPTDHSYSGSEPLQGIRVSPENIGVFTITEEISANLTVSQLEKLVPNGERYRLEFNNTSQFSFEYNDTTITYSWNDDYVDTADIIMLDFS